jgi:hypothetical protein
MRVSVLTEQAASSTSKKDAVPEESNLNASVLRIQKLLIG